MEVKQRRRMDGWLQAWVLCGGLVPMIPVLAQVPDVATQELLRQQERERVLREQQEARSDVRLERAAPEQSKRLPDDETPCFPIHAIVLEGEHADAFSWALPHADVAGDPVAGRCLGTTGINLVMARIQDAIIAKGYVTTRLLAPPQDLTGGTLTLTVVPGRVGSVRFDEPEAARTSLSNALPVRGGELLNLRDIEQGLENLQRVPTVAADIQIVPAEGPGSLPGYSDLMVSWQQPMRLRGQFSLDDGGSESTGKWQLGATLSIDNPLRVNDLFYVNLGRDLFSGDAKGTSSWTAHYSIPADYWLLGATASQYDYRQTVVGPYENYVYSGSSRNAELRVARVLFRNARNRFGMHMRGWWNESDNFIDDVEVEVQRRRMAGWELGASHKLFLGTATLESGVSYRRGSGAFDALPAPEELFGEGTARMKLVSANGHLSVPFRAGAQTLRYTGSWRAQWNRTPLVPQDRFAIGGRYTVRGFDGKTSLAGERGWLLRNELGLSLGGGQEAYVGLDHGRVSGPSTVWQPGDRLSGMALGLRGGWQGLSWDGFVGAPLSVPDGFPTAYTTLGINLNWSF